MTTPGEQQLALDWLGGATERRMRHARPGFDDLPWASFDASAIPSNLEPSAAVAIAVTAPPGATR